MYAINSKGTSYGTAASFTTLKLPVVTTAAVTILTTTATGNGDITDLGSPALTAYGVCWNTTGTPTVSDSKTDNGTATETGAFTTSMTGLSPNTLYYVRAYVTNSAGTVYGDEVNFTTNVATGLYQSINNKMIYINSSRNEIMINSDKISALKIYDMSGSLVFTQELTGKSVVNINTLKAGIYIVKADGFISKMVIK
ncbi:MAG: T9SS type A sorting domain-containing protein [Paludibacter sp.]|nr:T9SS type A sorting domain-containing protein [Paludibacter sp.]